MARPRRACFKSYPFGHFASEDDQPPPLCTYCGTYHYISGHCPEDGPSHVPGKESDDAEPWPEPDRPVWTFVQVMAPSPN